MGQGPVRPAGPDDAEAIARVHVETWRATYRGLVPDHYLLG
ncbi:MAG TPA: GNAT family N-acetyltransferase, partial [Pseudomonadota bacterium]|nr:GNAT family N-acetyltransferase [Pseudomonadota bacterium]